MLGASESLPQSDIDLKGIVTANRRRRDRGLIAHRVAPVGGDGDIKPDGSDRRVISHPRPDAYTQRVRLRSGHGREVRRDFSGVHEKGGAETGTEALPQFQIGRPDRGTADRGAIGKRRADRLITIPPNGAAAAGVEALVRRQAEFPRPLWLPPDAQGAGSEEA